MSGILTLPNFLPLSVLLLGATLWGRSAGILCVGLSLACLLLVPPALIEERSFFVLSVCVLAGISPLIMSAFCSCWLNSLFAKNLRSTTGALVILCLSVLLFVGHGFYEKPLEVLSVLKESKDYTAVFLAFASWISLLIVLSAVLLLPPLVLAGFAELPFAFSKRLSALGLRIRPDGFRSLVFLVGFSLCVQWWTPWALQRLESFSFQATSEKIIPMLDSEGK